MAFHSSSPRTPRILRAYLSRPRLPGHPPIHRPCCCRLATNRELVPSLSGVLLIAVWPGGPYPERGSRGLPGFASAGPSEPHGPGSTRPCGACQPSLEGAGADQTCADAGLDMLSDGPEPACVGNAHGLVETAVYLCPLRPGSSGVSDFSSRDRLGPGCRLESGLTPGRGLTPHRDGPKAIPRRMADRPPRRVEQCIVVAVEKA